MKKILIPTDFTDCSKDACIYALELGNIFEIEIHLIHAFYDPFVTEDLPDPSTITDPSELITHKVVNNVETEASDYLKNFKNELLSEIESRNLRHTPINTILVRGFAEDEIINLSKKINPDLIVMGTEGKGRVLTSIFGNVTTKTISEANAPVLVIHEGTKFRRIKNIMYATDFDESDFESINSLIQLLGPMNLSISCIHFNTGEKDDMEHEQAEALSRHLYNSFGGLVKFEVFKSDNLVDGFNDFVEKNNIDLISLSNHKRGLWEKVIHPSITIKMLFNTETPMLVFHSRDNNI